MKILKGEIKVICYFFDGYNIQAKCGRNMSTNEKKPKIYKAFLNRSLRKAAERRSQACKDML